MKPEQKRDPVDPELDPLLATWERNKSLPLNFKAGVWKRIQAEQLEGQGVDVFGWVLNAINVLGRKQSIQIGYVCLASFVGIGVGWVHAKRTVDQYHSEMKVRYLSLANPYYQSER